MKKPLYLAFAATLFVLFVFPQFPSAQNHEKYTLVTIDWPSDTGVENLIQAGIGIDHYRKVNRNKIEFVVNQQECLLLTDLGYSYKIVIEDMNRWYDKLLPKNPATLKLDCGLSNYDLGSMGGYHTLVEVTNHLSRMQSEHPAIVLIDTIGTSHEGRAIVALKISDDVMEDESQTEGVVYFDALTHAREPISMEVLLYYMWWLLENYETNEEAAYLINNREIYFVPVVNPDGYVYNQSTNPGGGGFWRKNRRDNGSGCFGVDLNRNYGTGWGLNTGSSNDPCSNIYRGPEAFSEPESAAVRDFILEKRPSIGFSVHSFGETFLSPFGYTDSLATYHLYAEFVSEFVPPTYIGYGTTAKMLGYTSSGTTRDYFHSEGMLAWTPEVGQAFWESSFLICDRVTEFLKPVKYLSWVSGAYACFHDFELPDDQKIWAGDTLSMVIRVKNRGLSKSANNVQVQLNSLDGLLSPLNAQLDYGSIEARQFADNASNHFNILVNDGVELLDRLALEVIVFQDNTESYRDTVYLTAGQREALFEDKAEDGMTNWISSGTGTLWDTTFMDGYSGQRSFSDSRYGNYVPSSMTSIQMINPIDLTGTNQPMLEFLAKWSLEIDYDFTSLQISTDMGISWSNLQGLHTLLVDNEQVYNQNQHWVQEQIDLSAFKEEQILIRFLLDSDFNVHSDGFYFDDFAIVDYVEPEVVGTSESGKTPSLTLSIYPNPGKGLFYLDVDGAGQSIAYISLLDAIGRCVYKEFANVGLPNHHKLDLSDVPAGVYFVKVETPDGIGIVKILNY